MFGTGTAILTSVYPAGERGWVWGQRGSRVPRAQPGTAVGRLTMALRLAQHLHPACRRAHGSRSHSLATAGRVAGARGERFDSGGACLSGLGLVLLVFGLSAASG
jgi:hypothetical protein